MSLLNKSEELKDVKAVVFGEGSNPGTYIVKRLILNTSTGHQYVQVEEMELGEKGLQGQEISFDKQGKPVLNKGYKNVDAKVKLNNLKKMTEIEFMSSDTQDNMYAYARYKNSKVTKKDIDNAMYKLDKNRSFDMSNSEYLMLSDQIREGKLYNYNTVMMACNTDEERCNSVADACSIRFEEFKQAISEMLQNQGIELDESSPEFQQYYNMQSEYIKAVLDYKPQFSNENAFSKKVEYARKNRLPSKMLIDLCVGIDKKLLSQKENKEEIEQANAPGLNR